MKKLLIITLLIAAGCAENNNNPVVEAALTCEMPANEDLNSENQASDQNINQMNLSQMSSGELSSYQNFIVKYKKDSIRPSGNTLKEYNVKGITFRAIAKNTLTFSLNISADERKTYIEELQADEDVEYIEPDYPIYTIYENNQQNSHENITTATNDPYFSKQWMHENVQTEKAWSITTGSNKIVVAVLDSGIDYTHSDLKNNMWMNPQEKVNGKDDDGNGYIDDVYGWNFVSNNAYPKTTSKSNHGSHVAGIIGASGSNNLGIIGMAPNVKMMALRFIGDTGTGSTSGAIRGIDYAVSKKVFAINNSWGSPGTSKALGDAISRAEKAGILFFEKNFKMKSEFKNFK